MSPLFKSKVSSSAPNKGLASALSMKRKSSMRMADGGGVQLDPDKAKQAEDSMRKAFGGTKETVKPLAKGGTVGMEDSEMGQGLPGMVKMAKAQGEADAHAMIDSEMGHFAQGGMPGMEDSEMGKGLGTHIAMPMEGEELNASMKSSEMDRFANGGMAGNPKLQQAYKSAHESVMQRHRAKMMADGGQVDIELNAMEDGEDSSGGSDYEKMDQEAAQKENYDEGMHSASTSERIRRKKMMG